MGTSFLKHIVFWGGVAAAAVVATYLAHQPDVEALRTTNPTSTTLMQLRKEQAKRKKVAYPTLMVWKNIDHISPHLVHAVLLAEDDTFYQHRGFDFDQIKEAVKINWRKKRYAYGGSTISQQLARTLFLSPKKNLIRKAKEAVLTYRLERALSKKRILEIYLNVIEWGRGIYGAEAAAQFYFGKAAEELDPDEAVALASVLPSPRRWSPVGEQAFMARRRSQLLGRMRRAGYLPEFAVEIPTGTFEPGLPMLEEPPLDQLQGDDFEHIAPEQPD